MIMCVLLCYPVSIRIYYQQGGLFLVFVCFEFSSVQAFIYVFLLRFKMSAHQMNKDKLDLVSVVTFASHLTHIIIALPVGNLARVMTPVSLLKIHVKYALLLQKNKC